MFGMHSSCGTAALGVRSIGGRWKFLNVSCLGFGNDLEHLQIEHHLDIAVLILY